MSLNAYTGWGISTALLWLMNKRSNKDTSSQQDPSNLSVNSSATKIGSPIPVILGRGIIKEPLISYFGDFDYAPYTETYSAHAHFDGKSMVIGLILTVIASAFTTINVTPAVVTTHGGNSAGPVVGNGTAVGGTYKDIVTPVLILTLFNWLLYWLINGRNLKTTIQKGFKYYLGWQHLICWSSGNAQIKRVYMDENKIYEIGGTRYTKPNVVCIGDDWTSGFTITEETITPYPTRLQALMPNHHIVNGGLVGNTAITLRQNFQNVLDLHPTVVIIQCGVNDVINGRSVSDILIDIDYMVGTCMANEIIPFVCNLPPTKEITVAGGGIGSLLIQGTFNTLRSGLINISNSRTVPFIDIYTPFMRNNSLIYEYFTEDDLVHFRDKGYEKLADLVYVTLLKVGYYNHKKVILDINEPDLFGGVDENGGFVGQLRLYHGGRFQQKDSWMIQQMSLPTVQEEVRGLTPVYKNFITAVIPKSYIGKQSSIPSMWFEITNFPCNLGFKPIGEDLNPAEALFEIITNTEWGCKEAPEGIDLEMLVKLGETCANEKLGISIKIDQNTPAKDVVNNILDLINAVRYADTRTGKLVFKLIRDDYKEEDLLVLNQTNCEQLEFNRLDWSETVSNITVDYIEPNNKYENGTVTYRDMANPLITGTKTEKKLDGSFFTTPTNALAYAQRESISQGYPLASVSIVANREAGKLTIGDPFIINWLPYGIAKMLMRVTDIDYGSLTDGRIKIEALEDVFGFGRTKYEYGDGIQWTKPEMNPQEVEYKSFFEVPFEMQHSLDTYVNVVATQPSQYTVGYTVWRFMSNQFKQTASTTNWTPTGRLVYGYGDDTSYIDGRGVQIREVGMSGYIDRIIHLIEKDTSDVYNNRAGTLLMMIDDEIMSFDTIEQLPNGDYVVKGIIRGIYDTIVRPHTAEAVAFFLVNPLNINGTERLARKGELTAENLNVTTFTTDKATTFDYNRIQQFNTTRRSEQPSVMGGVEVGSKVGMFTQLRRKFNAVIGGDITFKFKPRDKFKVNGVIAQDETVYRGQILKASDTMENVLVISNGSTTVEHIKPAKDVTEFLYKWVDYCNDFNTPLNSDVVFYLSTRDSVTGLYSYDKHIIPTKGYIIPQLVGIVPSVSDVADYAQLIGRDDTIIVPSGNYNQQIALPYNLCALIMVGIPDPNGIYGQDGQRYKVSNEVYRVIGKKDGIVAYQKEFLEQGYIFKSGFSEDGTAIYYYKYDNSELKEWK